MFYLFSSDYEARFKRNVLDVLSYPEEHIFRFRYNQNHVAPEIKRWHETGELNKKLKGLEGRGLSIYAEKVGSAPNELFDFYPLREIELIRVQVIGNVYYVDMRLGRFVDYYSLGQQEARSSLQKLQESIKTIKFYPLPLLENNPQTGMRWGFTWTDEGKLEQYKGTPGFTNQGYFFNHSSDCTCSIKFGQSGNPRAWESVVEVLSVAPSMESALFYLIEGFYRVRKQYFFGLFGEHQECLIQPKDNGWDTQYPLKMGTSVVLKLLFFRSSKAPRISDRSFEIKTDGDAFAGFSQREIPVLSRYNEERILIACKRVFDSILAPIVIELSEKPASDGIAPNSGSTSKFPQISTPCGVVQFKVNDPAPPEAKILAPHPFLLTQVTASKWIIAATLLFLVLASFFLFMSQEYIQQVGWSQIVQTNSKPFGDALVRNAAAYAQLSKVLGAVFTLVAGFLAFRKLPLGK
jgi:hypothetical protein